MKKTNIAVLVSGGGTNLQALIDAEKAGIIRSGSIKLVVSNNKNVMGKYKNGIVLNILAVIVIAVFIFIAARNMTAFITSVKALF